MLFPFDDSMVHEIAISHIHFALFIQLKSVSAAALPQPCSHHQLHVIFSWFLFASAFSVLIVPLPSSLHTTLFISFSIKWQLFFHKLFLSAWVHGLGVRVRVFQYQLVGDGEKWYCFINSWKQVFRNRPKFIESQSNTIGKKWNV